MADCEYVELDEAQVVLVAVQAARALRELLPVFTGSPTIALVTVQVLDRMLKQEFARHMSEDLQRLTDLAEETVVSALREAEAEAARRRAAEQN